MTLLKKSIFLEIQLISSFGYMLVMGDYVWIPFVFSLQSLYLEQPRESHTWYYILNVIIFIVGMIIFREYVSFFSNITNFVDQITKKDISNKIQID